MRTNIEIDDKVMKAAMAASGKKTKREVVDEALKMLIRTRGQRRIRELFGAVEWVGSLDEMRLDK